MMDDQVKALVDAHAFLQVLETGDEGNKRIRIKCDLTNHEMLPKKELIEAHLQSKKFMKAKEWYCYDYSKYEPYIVSHRRKPKCLYCNVTNQILNRIPAEVEKHVNGKRFKRLKEHVKFTEKKGNEDNDKEEFDANQFEFMNSQVIYSDDEEREEGDEDDDEEDEELDDDMKDLYPSDDESDEEQLPMKNNKRKEAPEDQEDGDEAEEQPVDEPKQPERKAKPTGRRQRQSRRSQNKRQKKTN